MALIVDIPMPKNCHECHLYCDFTRRMDIDRNEHERPQDCLIKGEIPDEHGRLIDGDKLERRIKYVSCDNCHPQSKDDCRGCGMRKIVDEVESMTTIVEATEDFAKELEKYDEKVALNRERRIEDVGAK